MQIYQVLKQEHDKVKALFEELEDTTERAVKTRTQTLQKLQQELSVHMAFEEEHLYPRLEEPEETHELALEAIEEHNAARTLLEELAEVDPSDETWKAKLTVLKENIEHHVEEEEGELFPKAKKLLDREEAERLAALYEEFKTSERQQARG